MAYQPAPTRIGQPLYAVLVRNNTGDHQWDRLDNLTPSFLAAESNAIAAQDIDSLMHNRYAYAVGLTLDGGITFRAVWPVVLRAGVADTVGTARFKLTALETV